ncbi:MAG: homocysteine S-methyltransferase family protein [Proteobacteria bacterium]|nr:homocysteine S-methyltransferase family protein [Pseudomonadota bacterium]
MSKYRNDLPQLKPSLFLTDGGLETTLVFHENIDLPHFAAFDLLQDTFGGLALESYYKPYLKIAAETGRGFILDTATWRANADWAQKLGYSQDELAAANQQSVNMLVRLRNQFETDAAPIVLNGVIGPRGDGYVAGELMSVEEAKSYHSEQIDTFAGTEVDMVTAVTMTNTHEAIGIVSAAEAASLPVAIAFTVETDGHLPSGQELRDAIMEVDAATEGYASYFMINCAHPTHFEDALLANGTWITRIKGIRANASSCSHEELDNATELDCGDPLELGRQYRELLEQHGHINILGGCCGTDHRHIEQISQACSLVKAVA